ncbi:HAD family phosphatase [Micromonospora fluostatini]|uniref:HAD family phosphatase n=1 Tax=Micromonospora fluostatini TaxID=1629071 RepID=A0ABY2DLL6_9ACTN|nr:HAD family phosphatase [Micromonospora fluostatini]
MSIALEQLCGDVDALLLDFDGPVCGIFAGYPASQVAGELLDLLRGRAAAVAERLCGEPDPLEVLRQVGADRGQAVTAAVEDALIAAEVRAVGTAEPTAYARETIVAATHLRWPVAVVSNNSAEAVTAYLRAHRLSGGVAVVVGRPYADPARMKPNPAPILDAAQRLGIEPARCVLVGDSVTDIEGAHAAGTKVVGYANKPPKVQAFVAAGADVVVTSMRDVAQALVRAGGGTSCSARLRPAWCCPV